jgi:hypothetical protein
MADVVEKDLRPDHVTRAWSTLKLEIKKTADGEQRTIKGIASTPTTDRMGDIVEPKEWDSPTPAAHLAA